MQRLHIPRVDTRYWLGILLASVFGTNLGDLYADRSGLSLQGGLALLAALAAVVFAAERADRRKHQLYYWTVIIIIRTGATNIADFLAYKAHIPMSALCTGLAALLAILGWRAGAPRAADAGGDEAQLPATGGAYWLAMLVAGVLGTALGDYCQHLLGQGTAALALIVPLASLLAFRGPEAASMLGYWAIVALARTAGTAVGDFFAENDTLAIGLLSSTCLSGLAFVAMLIYPAGRRSPGSA